MIGFFDLVCSINKVNNQFYVQFKILQNMIFLMEYRVKMYLIFVFVDKYFVIFVVLVMWICFFFLKYKFQKIEFYIFFVFYFWVDRCRDKFFVVFCYKL